MDLLSRTQLRRLMEERGEYCASIFMPTHRKGPEIRQDPIRLKNLIVQAEAKLVEAGLRGPEARELLSPAQELVEMAGFWRHQSDGLALFLAEDAFHSYRLPLDFVPSVSVGMSYHIRPLLPLLAADARFYVLALSQNEVRLLQGAQHSVEQVELQHLPPSLDEALQWDDPERRLQWHTRTGNVAKGERAAIFHGHGVASSDDPKDYIRRFFRQVDAGLQRVVGEEEIPMVLAGVDYILDIYREVNSYPQILKEGIAGNPEELSARELHRHAWAIVHPRFQTEREEAVAQYRYLAAAQSELASNKVQEIVPAALHGRVEVLFAALDLHQWGSFEADTSTVELRKDAKAGDEDLLDFAAANTLLNGGTVYALEGDKVPDGAPMAAVFRF